jgi:hypothetical protein
VTERPLGQLDLLPGVQQRHPADLPEVVLDRVGRSAGRGHPRGRQVLIVIAGTQRLVPAVPARRLRRAAGRSRDAAPAGAWPLPAGRRPRGARLTPGRARARHLDPDSRQRPADPRSVAVPARAGPLTHAHNSVHTTTTGSRSQRWPAGQPAAAAPRPGLGKATR